MRWHWPPPELMGETTGDVGAEADPLEGKRHVATPGGTGGAFGCGAFAGTERDGIGDLLTDPTSRVE